MLSAAKEVGFPYVSILAKAENGNTYAITQLINFSVNTDAAASLAHGCVLLDLKRIVGKEKFLAAWKRASNVGRARALGQMETATECEGYSRDEAILQ